MLKRILVAAATLTLAAGSASAEDWVGQPTAPLTSGSLGKPVGQSGYPTETLVAMCEPSNTPLPCGPGSAPDYVTSTSAGTVQSFLPTLPASAGPGSSVGVQIAGVIPDPNSPTGVSLIGGSIPLDAFAKSSTVDALAATTNDLTAQLNGLGGTVSGLASTVNELGGTVNGLAASVNGLSSQVHSLSTGFAQLQQQLAIQDRSLRRGVAMSLAMDGTGALASDENFAATANLGTFGGQNGVAASVAVRAADHITFDGGIGTGLHGGLVGARAGIRIGW